MKNKNLKRLLVVGAIIGFGTTCIVGKNAVQIGDDINKVEALIEEDFNKNKLEAREKLFYLYNKVQQGITTREDIKQIQINEMKLSMTYDQYREMVDSGDYKDLRTTYTYDVLLGCVMAGATMGSLIAGCQIPAEGGKDNNQEEAI